MAFEVDSRDDVDAGHERCLARGARIHFAPQEERHEAVTGPTVGISALLTMTEYLPKQ